MTIVYVQMAFDDEDNELVKNIFLTKEAVEKYAVEELQRRGVNYPNVEDWIGMNIQEVEVRE